jgi:hypothetical protein
MFLWFYVSVLSVRILTVIDMFLFELILSRFLVNPVSGRTDFNFVFVFKCKSENSRKFIPTNLVFLLGGFNIHILVCMMVNLSINVKYKKL